MSKGGKNLPNELNAESWLNIIICLSINLIMFDVKLSFLRFGIDIIYNKLGRDPESHPPESDTRA